ncbi:FtsW/RodA/SpoVE family cell cycle protein [Clostridium hydrogenum]|uniref:FtsW/RodA/SpoVE family cell cycle protein n=1 Tax=Clostridium hydrogenum TaxID=2855764 RepID=UPI001F314476|nr:FtsW/RodA/SpoVE family cell cycle protein [Clostridium hydrogenum]
MGIKHTAFKKYTDEVCSQIKCKEVHSEIKEELTNHLEEIKEEYIMQGASLEEAERQAVAHMGDSEKIGFDLDKIYRKRPEYRTLIVTCILVTLGILVQLIISKNIPYNLAHISFAHIFISNILGIICAAGLYFFDYRKIEIHSKELFVFANILIIFLLAFGTPVNGVKFFIFFNFRLDIAFIATILYIISLCGILPKLRTTKYYKIKIVSIYALCAFLILLTKNFPYIIFFTLVFLVMLVYLGYSKKYILAFSLIIFFALFCHAFTSVQYRYKLTSFINYNQFKDNIGYINYEIHELLSSATLFGKGVSVEAFKLLPSITSTFTICYIIYAFGWAAGILIFSLVLILLVNLFIKIKFIKNNYGKTLFLSISALFAFEFLQSILLNLNLSSILSITTPFISYSGTSTLINMLLIGLINSIYARKNLHNSLQSKEPRFELNLFSRYNKKSKV